MRMRFSSSRWALCWCVKQFVCSRKFARWYWEGVLKSGARVLREGRSGGDVKFSLIAVRLTRPGLCRDGLIDLDSRRSPDCAERPLVLLEAIEEILIQLLHDHSSIDLDAHAVFEHERCKPLPIDKNQCVVRRVSCERASTRRERRSSDEDAPGRTELAQCTTERLYFGSADIVSLGLALGPQMDSVKPRASCQTIPSMPLSPGRCVGFRLSSRSVSTKRISTLF